MKSCALACALLLVACATPDKETSYLHHEPFTDIPAPRGSTYIDQHNQSYAYQTSTWRCGRFLYEWRGSDTEVAKFYKDTMTAPPYSWTLTDTSTPAEGSTALHFVKGDDTCRVDIDRIPKPLKDDNISIAIRVNYPSR